SKAYRRHSEPGSSRCPGSSLEGACRLARWVSGMDGGASVIWAAGHDRCAAGGLRAAAQRAEDPYCKDADRRGSHEHTSFDFLGYTFRPRLSKNRREVLPELLPGGLERGEDRDATRDAPPAAAPSPGQDPHGPGA